MPLAAVKLSGGSFVRMSKCPEYEADNAETGEDGSKLRDFRPVHERNVCENYQCYIGRENIRHNPSNREATIERALIEMASVGLRNRLTPDEPAH